MTDSHSKQSQFLDVVDRDEAERRLHAAIDVLPSEDETVALAGALGRVLSRDVIAQLDVPSFQDRSVRPLDGGLYGQVVVRRLRDCLPRQEGTVT